MKKREERKAKMLVYLKEYKEMYNISPTIREMCIACDIPSTSSASSIIEECKKEGYISTTTAFQSTKSCPRSFIITKEGEEYIKTIKNQIENKEKLEGESIS